MAEIEKNVKKFVDKGCQTDPLDENFPKKSLKNLGDEFFFSAEPRDRHPGSVNGSEWRDKNREDSQQEKIRSSNKTEILKSDIIFFNNKWISSPRPIVDFQCHPFEPNLLVSSYCEPTSLFNNRIDQISKNGFLNKNNLFFNNNNHVFKSDSGSPFPSLPSQTTQTSDEKIGEKSIENAKEKHKQEPKNNSKDSVSHVLETSRSDISVIVWSIEGKPISNLYSMYQVTCVNFDPENRNILIGGTQIGQILFWDTRVGNLPVLSSKLISSTWKGHLDTVNNLHIIGSEGGERGGERGDVVSTCKAGRLCTWKRTMLDKPYLTLELRQPGAEDSINLATQFNVTPTSLSFPSAENNRFFLGSQAGQLFEGSLVGTAEGDLPGIFRQIGQKFDQRRPRRWSSEGFPRSRNSTNRHSGDPEAHRGLVSGLHCHPGKRQAENVPSFADLMLTSSWDWTCNLWSSQDSSRPLWSVEYVDVCHDIQWSPRHPFLFSVLSGKNKVQLWHLGRSLSSPICEVSLSLTLNTGKSIAKGGKLRWTCDGEHVICGDLNGRMHVLNVTEEETLESISSEEVDAMCEKLEALRTRGR